MEILLNLESDTSHYHIRSLRQLHDTVESNVRSSKSLQVSRESHGGLLSSILMNKLPQEFRLVVTGEIGDDDWPFDELLDIFKRELEAREGLESQWWTRAKTETQGRWDNRCFFSLAVTLTSTSFSGSLSYPSRDPGWVWSLVSKNLGNYKQTIGGGRADKCEIVSAEHWWEVKPSYCVPDLVLNKGRD